jgi:hypothetical protein
MRMRILQGTYSVKSNTKNPSPGMKRVYGVFTHISMGVLHRVVRAPSEGLVRNSRARALGVAQGSPSIHLYIFLWENEADVRIMLIVIAGHTIGVLINNILCT